MSSPKPMLRKTESKTSETKHVTFACPSSGSKQHVRKSKSDQRKRQTHQQSGKEKKAKHSEQNIQLYQSEEILLEVEHGCKILEERVRSTRDLASATMNELGELICQYAELDSKLSTIEDSISEIENNTPMYADTTEVDQLVKEVEQRVAKYEEFDVYLSELADRMSESSDQCDCTQLFYEALPTIERMLSGLSL